MSSRVRNRLRALATSATSLLVASSMVFALAPAVSAAPTSSETSTATSTSKKNFLDGLFGGKSDEATSMKAPASTVTSINHLRDLFDAPLPLRPLSRKTPMLRPRAAKLSAIKMVRLSIPASTLPRPLQKLRVCTAKPLTI